jgi:hypothetical protein
MIQKKTVTAATFEIAFTGAADETPTGTNARGPKMRNRGRDR